MTRRTRDGVSVAVGFKDVVHYLMDGRSWSL
jgi:hypothetical protein